MVAAEWQHREGIAPDHALRSARRSEAAAAAPSAAPAHGAFLRVLGDAPPALVLDGQALELTERHAEILLALSRAGNGLCTAELSEQLWAGRAQETTVRAEVLRLSASGFRRLPPDRA